MEKFTTKSRINSFKIGLTNIPLDTSTKCSYFDDKISQAKSFRVSGDIPLDLFEIALDLGFRRCGDVYYQFNCPSCSLCQSYRVVVSEFQPTRSQKRVIRRNQDVKDFYVVPKMTSTKEKIYLRYQHKQHLNRNTHDSDTSSSADTEKLLDTMRFQMYTNPSKSVELEFYLNKSLVGFGILDVAIESVSAVYFVFDPDYRSRSLGTLAILRGIEWAKSKGFKYYHLGFYIPGHPKMDYKKFFGKSEILNRSNFTWEIN